jgi:hypothetical protein
MVNSSIRWPTRVLVAKKTSNQSDYPEIVIKIGCFYCFFVPPAALSFRIKSINSRKMEISKILDSIRAFVLWFVLVIIGVGLVVVACVGQIPNYLTVPASGKIGIIITGSIIGIVGLAGFWKESFSAWFRVRNKYGIKTHFPNSSSSIQSPFDASGIFRRKPNSDNPIYVVQYQSGANLYWPKNVLLFDEGSHQWSSRVNIGGGNNTKHTIIIAEISPAGMALINYYRDVSTPTTHKGIRDFNRCFIELDRVTFTLLP